MIYFEKQRIATSKKDKQWRKNMVDAICSRTDEFNDDWYRMWQNYRLKNNQIDQEEFREYCDTLGIDKREGRQFVEPFNKAHTVIDVMKGEAESMPWNFNVVNISPNSTNEVLRNKDRELMSYIDFKISAEIELNQKRVQLNQQLSQGEITQQQAEGQLKQLAERLQIMESKVLNPEDIEKKYRKYKSTKEVAAYKLLTSVIVNENVRWTKNQTFEDALIAGVEAVEVTVNEATGLPKLKQMNVLNLFYHKSSDTPFIHDSVYAGYKEEVSVADVLDEHGNDLDEKDIERLQTYQHRVYGLDQPLVSSGGMSVDKWDYRQRFDFRNRHPLSTVPNMGTGNVLSSGLYTTNRDRYTSESYCVRYVVYWRSQRRVGRLTFINDEGEEEITFVDEEFKIPKRAKSNKYKKYEFSRTRTLYEWKDSKGLVRTFEWLWIPEIWKGVRINGDIYCKIEPYEHAYQSLLNPYKVKLPIHGFVYNNRNAYSISVMDRIKPWQKLYYVVMSKWLKLITLDKGVIHLLNILMMDKDLGYEKALQLAVDQGALPYNPLAVSQGAGVLAGNTMKPSEVLDLSNTEQIVRYTEMLRFIEEQLEMSAGITKARLAQTASNSNVSDNMRDVQQSMNITSSVFNNHNMMWQEVLQTLLECTVKTIGKHRGIMRQLLNDEEIALIDLDMFDIDDELIVKVLNTNKQQEMLDNSKALIQKMVYDDKAKLSTLIELIGTENMSEFKNYLKDIEDDIDRREEMMQMQQQQQEQQMKQEMMAMEEKLMKDKKELEHIKGQYSVKAAELRAMGWFKDNDINDNDVPDVLEIDKLKNDKELGTRKLDDEKEHSDKMLELEYKKLELSNKQIESEQALANAKLAVERQKIKEMAKKNNSKK